MRLSISLGGRDVAALGMIHGRFQPFHDGHWEYLALAAERCERLIVGITNPDPTQIVEEPTSDHRHTEESNPYSYFDRMMMIRAAVAASEIELDRVIFTPFPINLPERWRHYIPSDVVHYLRVFSPWEQAKVDRLRDHGYEVEVLTPGVAKQIEATDIRAAIRNGDEWQSMVPAAVANYLTALSAAEQA